MNNFTTYILIRRRFLKDCFRTSHSKKPSIKIQLSPSYLVLNTTSFSLCGHHQELQIIKYFEEGEFQLSLMEKNLILYMKVGFQKVNDH